MALQKTTVCGGTKVKESFSGVEPYIKAVTIHRYHVLALFQALPQFFPYYPIQTSPQPYTKDARIHLTDGDTASGSPHVTQLVTEGSGFQLWSVSL